MKKKLLAGLAVGLFMLGMAGVAQANSMSYDFYNLTHNSSIDLSGQLQVTVWDAAQANNEYATKVSLTGNEVLFTFTNDVGIGSNIHEIYFDDGSLLALSTVYNSLGGFTNYTPGASPDELPGGNTAVPPFITTDNFLVDSTGNPVNGVNTSDDILGIAFTLQGTQSYDHVVAELNSGALRVGLHIGSIEGADDDSDSYINNPVPEPATMLLMGTGLAGLAAAQRRRKAKKS